MDSWTYRRWEAMRCGALAQKGQGGKEVGATCHEANVVHPLPWDGADLPPINRQYCVKYWLEQNGQIRAKGPQSRFLRGFQDVGQAKKLRKESKTLERAKNLS